MEAAKAYCLAGNAQYDWRVENNTQRNWYHMPGSITVPWAVKASTA